MELLIDRSLMSDRVGHLILLRHGEIDKEYRFGVIGDGQLSVRGADAVFQTTKKICGFLQENGCFNARLLSSSSVRCHSTLNILERHMFLYSFGMRDLPIIHEDFFMTEEERPLWAQAYAGMYDADGKRTPEYRADIEQFGRQAAVMKRTGDLVRACVERSCKAIQKVFKMLVCDAPKEGKWKTAVGLVTHGPHDVYIAQHFLGSDELPKELAEGQARIIDIDLNNF